MKQLLYPLLMLNESSEAVDIGDGLQVVETTPSYVFGTSTVQAGTTLFRHAPWEVYYFFGTYAAIIGVAGVIGNSTVLLIFTRFRRLRSPANTFVVNLAFCDLCAAALHPMTSYSSFRGEWAFGKIGCEVYGAGVGFFGLNSMVTLAAIAWERYIVISAQPLNGKMRMTRSRAQKVCLFIWTYVFCLVIPPSFGWSSYHVEGIGTSCSWDYTTQSTNNRSYYIFLLFFGFLVPLVVITVSYGIMFGTVVNSGNEIASMATPSQRGSVRKNRRKSDIKTAQVIISLILLFLVAWTPYSMVSVIGQFASSPLSPIATSIPAYCAKLLVVINPIVYGISHPHFRSSFSQYMSTLSSGSIYPPTTPKLATPRSRRSHYHSKTPCSPTISRPSFQSDTGYYYQRSCHDWQFEARQARHSSIARLSKASQKELTGNRSEPDLMRCDDRIIHGASAMAFTEYRIKKRGFLHRVLFRSETSLQVVRVANPMEIEFILNGSGKSDQMNEIYRQNSRQSSTRKRGQTMQTSVLSPVKDEGELVDPMFLNVPTERKYSLADSDSTTDIKRAASLKYRSENLAIKQMERRSTYRRWSSERRRSRLSQRVKKGSSHVNCCECAQIEFSQCVTVAKVPDGHGGSRVELCLDPTPRSSEAVYH